MDSQVSIQKNPESLMKFQLPIGSNKTKNIFFTHKQPCLSSFQEMDSKEESFFDSQARLESDCDDDFHSVNGDLTPSRNSSELETKPTLTSKKLKLSELLEDSFVVNEVSELHEQKKSDTRIVVRQPDSSLTPKVAKRSPISFGLSSLCRSKRSPSKHSKPEKENSTKSLQCCFPSLRTSLSFKERKKGLTPDCIG